MLTYIRTYIRRSLKQCSALVLRVYLGSRLTTYLTIHTYAGGSKNNTYSIEWRKSLDVISATK